MLLATEQVPVTPAQAAETASLTEGEIIEPVEVNRCDKFTLTQPAGVDLGRTAAPQWASFRVPVG
ncbi:MAG UNVERIFIED_CONTAM: hypothetical protein LVT10_06240 [Anaerolineae bacterium]